MQKSSERSFTVEIVKEMFHCSPDPIVNVIQLMNLVMNSSIINLPTLLVPKVPFTQIDLIYL